MSLKYMHKHNTSPAPPPPPPPPDKSTCYEESLTMDSAPSFHTTSTFWCASSGIFYTKVDAGVNAVLLLGHIMTEG